MRCTCAATTSSSTTTWSCARAPRPRGAARLPGAPGRPTWTGPRPSTPPSARGRRGSRPGPTPGVGEAVRAEDPLGFTVEFFAAADRAERLQQRYDLRRGAEPARMDHFNIVVPDVRAADEYYTSWASACPRRSRTSRPCTPPGCSASRPCTTWRSPGETARACTTWLLRPRDAPRAADLRHPRLAARGVPDRARPRPARRVQRLLRLPARPGRAPGGDLHQRLLHRRPRPPGPALVGARPAAPRLLGQPGGPVLVHRGQRGPRPGRPPAARWYPQEQAAEVDGGRGRLYPVTRPAARP